MSKFFDALKGKTFMNWLGNNMIATAAKMKVYNATAQTLVKIGTVVTSATTWFFLYQPKTPKGLKKYD